jgi:hypothetical protein
MNFTMTNECEFLYCSENSYCLNDLNTSIASCQCKFGWSIYGDWGAAHTQDISNGCDINIHAIKSLGLTNFIIGLLGMVLGVNYFFNRYLSSFDKRQPNWNDPIVLNRLLSYLITLCILINGYLKYLNPITYRYFHY